MTQPVPQESSRGRSGGLSASGIATAGLLTAGAAMAGLALYSAHLSRQAKRQVPRDGRMIEVEGTPLHVAERGSGPPLLLIHGLGGQLRNFNYGVVDRLAQNFRVIVIDRPGAGYSPALAERDTGILSQAAAVAALIRTMKLDRPLLVGHSLGGAIALAVALEQPDLVRGLALLAPLTQPPTRLPRLLAPLARLPHVARMALAATFAIPLARLSEDRVLSSAFAPERAVADFAIRGGGALSARPHVLAAAITDIATASADMAALAARYPDVSVPVRILFGRGDRVLEPQLHGLRTAAAIPGAVLELVSGGHMLPVTQPHMTADFIVKAWHQAQG